MIGFQKLDKKNKVKFLYCLSGIAFFILINIILSGVDLKSYNSTTSENAHHTINGDYLKNNGYRESVIGFVESGETLLEFSKKHGLKAKDLLAVSDAAKGHYNLALLKPGNSYKISVDRLKDEIQDFKYSIDSTSYLHVKKIADKYKSQKVTQNLVKRKGVIKGEIASNLINAIGTTKEHISVAYDLADMFSYDIDFNTDLKKKDSFKIVVEELYSGDNFKGYGDILYAKLINSGKSYEIVQYKIDGKNEYYRASGKSLKKTLMRAPLSYRHISSHFSNSRYHPILKIYRPHHGVDYVAPTGTPVSAAGDGTITFAGYRGGYGKMVIIKHSSGYETYYGHLSRLKKNIKSSRNVKQGEVIGYVGSTGLSTGPHLDYRVKLNGKFINPLTMKQPTMPIPKKHKKDFYKYVAKMRKEVNESLIASSKN